MESLHGDKHRRLYYTTKRVLDITIASIAILVLVPFLPIIALAIKLDSPGPVFFTQVRVRGRRTFTEGRTLWAVVPFRLYKFRTMAVAADEATHREYMAAYISGDEEYFAAVRADRKPGDSYRLPEDPRVTRVGAILRKLSIDEAPQLWNVLKGDMSIVGPRPPMHYETELYGARDYDRLASPGGLTGLAQIKGRCTVGFEEMVALDREYIGRQSIWFDLWVLVRTIPVVLSRKGAG